MKTDNKYYIAVKDLLKPDGQSVRSCDSLKENESVIFNCYEEIYKKKIPIDGNVIRVNKDSKTVSVIYLKGYRCEHDIVSYDDMLCVYNPNGVYMQFDNIVGRSDVLID